MVVVVVVPIAILSTDPDFLLVHPVGLVVVVAVLRMAVVMQIQKPRILLACLLEVVVHPEVRLEVLVRQSGLQCLPQLQQFRQHPQCHDENLTTLPSQDSQRRRSTGHGW